jgi:hypothetical protein
MLFAGVSALEDATADVGFEDHCRRLILVE